MSRRAQCGSFRFVKLRKEIRAGEILPLFAFFIVRSVLFSYRAAICFLRSVRLSAIIAMHSEFVGFPFTLLTV